MTHCIHCCAYHSCFLLLRKAALRAEHKTINASHVDRVHLLLKVINIHLIKKQGDTNHISREQMVSSQAIKSNTPCSKQTTKKTPQQILNPTIPITAKKNCN